MTCSRDELIFDHSIVLTSVTEDYDLTCDHSIVRSIFNSLYMGGMLLGNNKAYYTVSSVFTPRGEPKKQGF